MMGMSMMVVGAAMREGSGAGGEATAESLGEHVHVR